MVNESYYRVEGDVLLISEFCRLVTVIFIDIIDFLKIKLVYFVSNKFVPTSCIALKICGWTISSKRKRGLHDFWDTHFCGKL